RGRRAVHPERRPRGPQGARAGCFGVSEKHLDFLHSPSPARPAPCGGGRGRVSRGGLRDRPRTTRTRTAPMTPLRARLAVCSLALAAPVTASAGARRPAFFVSIDGLNPVLLETLTAKGVLDEPRGLGWLRREGVVVERAMPVVTTLTAASHVSTITC